MEKRTRISTQGRLTIPKGLRDAYGIRVGQPVVVRSGGSKREIVVEIMPEITDFK